MLAIARNISSISMGIYCTKNIEAKPLKNQEASQLEATGSQLSDRAPFGEESTPENGPNGAPSLM